jgi:hypothetical protein
MVDKEDGLLEEVCYFHNIIFVIFILKFFIFLFFLFIEGAAPFAPSVPDISQKVKEAQVEKEKQFLEDERKKQLERHQSFTEAINDPTKDFRNLLKRGSVNLSEQSTSKESLP